MPVSNHDVSTIQYRLNLSNALHSISPALSALHASRAAALHPELFAILGPSHCPKCGTYRFSGDHQISMRKKRKRVTSPRSKLPLRRCHLCGFSVDPAACAGPSLDNSSPPVQSPSDPSRSRAVSVPEQGQESPSTDTFQTTTSPPVPPLRGRQSHPKSHAKTSTLKDMLSRNRKREEEERAQENRQGSHEVLSVFLKQL